MPPVTELQPPTVSTGPTPPVKSHHWGWLEILIAIVLVLCAVIIALYFFVPQLFPKQIIDAIDRMVPAASVPPPSESSVLSYIRENSLPSIVRLTCNTDESGENMQVGTGIYFIDNGVPSVATNAHVVVGSDGTYYGCIAYFPVPGTGAFYESAYYTGDAYTYHESVGMIDLKEVLGIDYAVLTLKSAVEGGGASFSFPPNKPDVFANTKYCREGRSIEIGEKVYMVGYPTIAGDSLTFTDGVVSGFDGDFSENVKISASTNRGNSGGIVLGATDGCVLGMTTAATFSDGGNIGYAVAFSHIYSFLANLTDRRAYAPPTEETPLLNLTQVGDIIIKYPPKWTIKDNTMSQNSANQVISILSPSEGALDAFLDNMTIAVFKNATEADLQSIAEAHLENAINVDAAGPKKGVISINDQADAYYIIYDDVEGKELPFANGTIDVMFLKNGTLYNFNASADARNYVRGAAYFKIFQSMVESVQFIE